MARLLIVHHAPSRSTQALLERVLAGAHDDQIDGVEVIARPALEASAQDVLEADGYLIGTTANFGYMAGATKHFFDTVFPQVGGSLDPSGAPVADGGGSTSGRPWGLWVHGRYDTTGAVRSVKAIVGALGWREAAPVLDLLGDPTHEALDTAYELGGTLAALLMD